MESPFEPFASTASIAMVELKLSRKNSQYFLRAIFNSSGVPSKYASSGYFGTSTFGPTNDFVRLEAQNCAPYLQESLLRYDVPSYMHRMDCLYQGALDVFVSRSY